MTLEEERTLDAETNEAIERGYSAANSEWKTQALQCVEKLARVHKEFVSYDVFLATKQVSSSTHDLRAIGGLIREAARRGWIAQSGRYAKNKNRHGSPCPIWKSLLYQDIAEAA
jgi:hypothetical protein